MRQTFLTLIAAGSEEAMAQAMAEFQCPRDSIAVTSLGDNQFKAELLDHDADLRVEISSDKMVATVVDSIPAKGRGRVLPLEELLRKLKEAGVHVAPDADAAVRVVEKLALGDEVAGTIIAKGTLPQSARDAVIEPGGDWACPVFPGDALGKYIPPAPGKAGLFVTGEIFPPKEAKKPADFSIPKDAGCRLDESTSLVIAEQYGLVKTEEHQVRIQPLIFVTDKRMAIKATVYHRTFKGEPTTPAHFKSVWKQMQVTATLQKEALRLAIDKSLQRNAPVENVILCWGTLPKNGEDGRFEPTVVSPPDALGLQTTDGRIDYRARGMVHSVQPEDLLGRLIPSRPGVPGVDVFGLPMPAKQGRPFNLTPGENVRVSADGKEFFAKAAGMVFYQGNTIKITETFETKGDVNLEVGNIKLERGSVNIPGSVLAGFRVEAPGNVVVKEVIENAVVIAGGDVQVGCGIVMEQGGLVEAGGGISALYAQNAVLRAQGDVNISHEINSCSVFAGRSVIATRGRGKIIGGLLRCGEGVLAKEIGSPVGVETIIHLGVDRKTEVNLARKNELNETLQKIYASLGTGDIKETLEKAPPEKRQIVAEVLKARIRCEQELRDIENQILQEREDLRSDVNIRVKALNIIHPDVVIHCFNTQFKVTTSLSSPTIFYDAQQKKLLLA